MGFIKNAGDAIKSVIGLDTDEVGDQFHLLKQAYTVESTEDVKATVEGGGGDAGVAPGTYSIFNPFNVFRYSRFGMNLGEGSYDKEAMFDSTNEIALKDVNLDGVINQSGILEDLDNAKKINVENPTASTIIQWAEGQGREAIYGEKQVTTPVPYAAEDFIWCKYYGKIPNNRLVTLRRYPFPISDDIRVISEVSPPVPLAQAVTWYGSDVENPLNSIVNLSWGLNWKPIIADMQDVEGNEISTDSALGLLGIKDSNSTQAKIAKALLSNNVNLAELSGFDSMAQDYIRNSYGPNGPYWNRILGPVNVINKTQIRDRGFKDQKPIVINFEYSLRSYGGINPKIAFLDLLTNFLSLTHNTAAFWGGGARYFEKTGPKLDLYGMEESMLRGDTDEAIRRGMESMTRMMSQNINKVQDAIKNIETALGSGLSDKSISEISKLEAVKDEAGRIISERAGSEGSDESSRKEAGLLSQFSIQFMKDFMRKPLMMRSILDGREIGEWHLTVGNPMNPMIMMGNLICTDVDMTVGEVLGIDDFPTEFKFKVTLNHGRPRAKQDIESMFNLGKGRMAFSNTRAPASAMNSHGEYGTDLANTFTNTAPQSKAQSDANAENAGEGDSNTPEINYGAVKTFGARISNLYGSGYGSSGILPGYFTRVKTKD